jgi:hypothetical protein
MPRAETTSLPACKVLDLRVLCPAVHIYVMTDISSFGFADDVPLSAI